MPKLLAKIFGNSAALSQTQEIVAQTKQYGELLESPKLSRAKIERLRLQIGKLNDQLEDLHAVGRDYLTAVEKQQLEALGKRTEELSNKIEPERTRTVSGERKKEAPAFHSESASLVCERHPDHNEDRSFADDANGFYGVLDGVGGSLDGELAADTAVKIIARHGDDLRGLTVTETVEKLKEYFRDAREALLQESDRQYGRQLRASLKNKTPRPKDRYIDTTASVVKIVEDGDRRTAVIAHAGDSRVYTFNRRTGELIQRTLDHTPVLEDLQERKFFGTKGALKFQNILNEIDSYDTWKKIEAVKKFKHKGGRLDQPETEIDRLLSDGEAEFISNNALGNEIQAYFGDTDRARHQMTRSLLGQVDHPEDPDILTLELDKDEELLLTSDGVHDNLTQQEIQQILAGDFDLLEDPEIKTAVLKAADSLAAKLAAAAQVRSRQPGDRAKPDDMTSVYLKRLAPPTEKMEEKAA